MLPEACPIRKKCQRRNLQELDLLEHGEKPHHSLQLPPTMVQVSPDCGVVVEASFVPSNSSFSILIRQDSASEDDYILAASAETEFLPVSLVARLPDRRYIEVHLTK